MYLISLLFTIKMICVFNWENADLRSRSHEKIYVLYGSCYQRAVGKRIAQSGNKYQTSIKLFI